MPQARSIPEARIDPVSAAIDRLHEGFFSAPALRIGIAFSGGLDSTVLAHAVLGHKPLSENHSQFFALHVNHRLRPDLELAQEELLTIKNCLDWHLPLVLMDLNPGEVSSVAAGHGLEAAARNLRYRALEAAAERLQLSYILTAHHQDDELETLILRFFQGQSLSRGIPERRGLFVRPLLACSRQQIADYAQRHDLAWHEDSSNGQDDYLRNQLRHELVPVARKLFPGFAKALEGQRILAAQDENWLEAQALGLRWAFTDEKSESGMHIRQAGISRAEYSGLSFPVRWRAIRRVCEEFYRRAWIAQLPSRHFYAAAAELGLMQGKDSGEAVGLDLPRILLDSEGCQFVCSASRVFVRPRIVDCFKKGYLVSLTGEGCFKIPGVGSIKVLRRSTTDKEIAINLVVRSIRTTDLSPDDGRHLWSWLKSKGIPAIEMPLVPVVLKHGIVQAVLTKPWTGQDRWFVSADIPDLEIQYLELPR